MAWPDSLSTGLKEWAAVCSALEKGRQIILLRKGGIHESAGEFELDHEQFLLFPTYVHQKLDLVKPGDRLGIQEANAEPNEVRIGTAATVTDILPFQNREQMDVLNAEHIWLPALLDIRWNYRPENPLYLLLLRVYRLQQAISIENTLEYAGCKSWVPMGREINIAWCTPVLTDEEYHARRQHIVGQLGK
ncbi:MAG TPA: DUF1802 family protein [Tepidisphaeraceae bacterium]|nr:DUF1802 family protein [Tepidisphaeraceae bacterium]